MALIGELGLASGPAADAQLSEASAHADLVVLDLSDLSFIDCTGLRVLLAADTRLRQTGGQLVIIHSSRQVQRLFDLLGASARLDIRPGLGDLAAEPTRDARAFPLAPLGSADAG